MIPFRNLAWLFLVVCTFTLIGCKREADSGGATAQNQAQAVARSPDYEYRIREAELNQAAVLRAKELYERWAANPELRRGQFPEGTLVPYDLKKSDLPDFKAPEATNEVIKKIVRLVETEQFSKEIFAKELNLAFDERPRIEDSFAYGSSKFWFAKSKDGRIDDDCKVRDSKTIVTLPAGPAPRRGNISYSEIKTATGSIETFAFALPAVELSDYSYQLTRQGQEYTYLSPNPLGFGDNNVVTESRQTSYGRLLASKWLPWLYLNRLDQLTAGGAHWYSTTTFASQLAMQPVADGLVVGSFDRSIIQTDKNDWPPTFALLSEVPRGRELMAASIYTNNRVKQFVGKFANYKFLITETTSGPRMQLKSLKPDPNRSIKFFARCHQFSIERHSTYPNVSRQAINPQNIEELGNLIRHFSITLSGVAPTNPFQLVLGDKNDHPFLSDFSLHYPQGSVPVSLNHGLISTLELSDSSCVRRHASEVNALDLESCQREAMYDTIKIVPAYLDGPNCLDPQRVTNLIFAIRGEQEQRLGIRPETRFEQVAKFMGRNATLGGISVEERIDFPLSPLFFIGDNLPPLSIKKPLPPLPNLYDAYIGALFTKNCLVTLSIIKPHYPHQEYIDQLKISNVK